jgi:putative redox protein
MVQNCGPVINAVICIIQNNQDMQYKLEKPIHGTIRSEKYQCSIVWRNGKIIADEPIISGGKDTGPDPSTLLLSSLAACTLITLRMYIDHKGWNVPEIGVNVNLYQEKKDEEPVTFIDHDIILPATVNQIQKDRLIAVAKSCPISKILENKVQIQTSVNMSSV